MAIKYRAAANSVDLTQIPPIDTNLPPDLPPEIPAPRQSAVATFFVTDTHALTTQSSIPFSTPSSISTTISQTFASAAPTQSAATSKGGSGLGRGDIAAIVVPIALLAILVPIVILWYLDRKHRIALEKRLYHRNSKEAMLQKRSSIQKPPQPKGPKPARPDRTPQRSVVYPPSPERRNSLGLFNFELSPPSTPGTGWLTPNPRFSIARALQMRRSQPSIVLSQPRTSRGESDRPQTGGSGRRQTENSIFDPPPPYVIGAAPPKPTTHFAPLERIGTLHHAERPNRPTMQPAMAPTLPAIVTTNGALDVSETGYTPRYTPRASSEILQLPDFYGHVQTRSPSPTLPTHYGSGSSHPSSSYAAPERISDVSGLSDGPELWGSMRESRRSSLISPIDSSTVHPHQVL